MSTTAFRKDMTSFTVSLLPLVCVVNWLNHELNFHTTRTSNDVSGVLIERNFKSCSATSFGLLGEDNKRVTHSDMSHMLWTLRRLQFKYHGRTKFTISTIVGKGAFDDSAGFTAWKNVTVGNKKRTFKKVGDNLCWLTTSAYRLQ